MGRGGLCGSTSWEWSFFCHHQCCDYTKPNLGRVSWGKNWTKNLSKQETNFADIWSTDIVLSEENTEIQKHHECCDNTNNQTKLGVIPDIGHWQLFAVPVLKFSGWCQKSQSNAKNVYFTWYTETVGIYNWTQQTAWSRGLRRRSPTHSSYYSYIWPLSLI